MQSQVISHVRNNAIAPNEKTPAMYEYNDHKNKLVVIVITMRRTFVTGYDRAKLLPLQFS